MKKALFSISILAFLTACATYKVQQTPADPYPEHKTIAHRFFLIGDAGYAKQDQPNSALDALKSKLDQADEHSTVIFLGDNIYPKGFPPVGHPDYARAEHRLGLQLQTLENFPGKAIFIAGNHDWYNGLAGLKRQEKYIRSRLGKKSFRPKAGCPLDRIKISSEIDLILIDSQWYLNNWNRHPQMNEDCSLKTRKAFFLALEKLIKKSRGKTTLIALHHPLFTNGSHGGAYSFKSHLTPLPLLGSLKNLIRRTSGISHADSQYKRFLEFKKRLVTMAQAHPRIILVSGHDHNLQYLRQGNLAQIISGSGSKRTPVRRSGPGKFGYATAGFAQLDVFTDGSAYVQFIKAENSSVIYTAEVLSPNLQTNDMPISKSFSATVTTSVYSAAETQKSRVYRMLWGERYREHFSTKITVPTVDLDTLYGGLKVRRRGGGMQSKSLRLITKDGKKQYVIRALRKQGVQFLQNLAFKDRYVARQFQQTAAEALIMDIFSGSHPYAPFVVGDLSEAIGVFHLRPKLYFIPRQKALGDFNDNFGDELYMIEEHASDGHGELANFGFSNTVIDTDEVIEKIHSDEDYVIDEAAYIRARLLDMLIGDWDRHADQWRWLTFQENNKTVYRPLPRDRDQAFSIISDGLLLGAATALLPVSKHLRKYSSEINVKASNTAAFPLDKVFIQQADEDVWQAQALHIQKELTDRVIDQAFRNMPIEVQDQRIENIKADVRKRRENLQKTAKEYYERLQKYAVINGTHKDDYFAIERLANGLTKITAYRIKKGQKADTIHQKIYRYPETKEVWIYGMDDTDEFQVNGDPRAKIKIRIVGGPKEDHYDIQEGKRIILYDHKTQKNICLNRNGRSVLSDHYSTRHFDLDRVHRRTLQLLPAIGANPDDGFKLGLSGIHNTYGFTQNPYSIQHKFSIARYFATAGVEIASEHNFANILPQINLRISLQYNSPNFTQNFFGFGNQTENLNATQPDSYDLNYNRVRIQSFRAKTALFREGELGSKLSLGVLFESNQVERTPGRYIATLPTTYSAFHQQDFIGLVSEYTYENKDDPHFARLGFHFFTQAGFKQNLHRQKNFAYLQSTMGFENQLWANGRVVLASQLSGQFNFGHGYEFNQAANLGANTGLRGYRNQRFSAKRAFVQSTDLRWNIGGWKSPLIPLRLGIYGGFDYGTVWTGQEDTNNWHNSYGGGMFLTAAYSLTSRISAFHGSDGWRITFGLGLDF
ncbi:MAG: metallophosphoesterase [Flavobacteriaceae bacterium]